ncbi:YidC/Oxa1 family membrane protein insertase [Miltoncostaea oceani]|uniref:YidC/Oxa1 family membrane protein insertase n=1 Tax=Miltoncostaea oceani TaxID=2843216 RepID=UPI001C3DE525|nr:YidC/Oxa1 family membrane protein insertase [Miltoncostaea oceani]
MEGPLTFLGWPLRFVVDGAQALGFGPAGLIILVVPLIRILLYPIAHRQAAALDRLSALKPEITRIHTDLAGDREALQRELVGAYSTARVSPFGPLLLIVPQALALVSLYFAVAPEFGGSSSDLGLPPLAEPARVSLIGFGLVALYMAGFCGTLILSARRLSGEIGLATRILAIAVAAGALVALPITSVGLALYLAATAVCSLAQAALLYREFGPGGGDHLSGDVGAPPASPISSEAR